MIFVIIGDLLRDSHSFLPHWPSWPKMANFYWSEASDKIFMKLKGWLTFAQVFALHEGLGNFVMLIEFTFVLCWCEISLLLPIHLYNIRPMRRTTWLWSRVNNSIIFFNNSGMINFMVFMWIYLQIIRYCSMSLVRKDLITDK